MIFYDFLKTLKEYTPKKSKYDKGGTKRAMKTDRFGIKKHKKKLRKMAQLSRKINRRNK